MNEKTLKEARELSRSIEETKEALFGINEFIQVANEKVVTGSNFNWSCQSKAGVLMQLYQNMAATSHTAVNWFPF